MPQLPRWVAPVIVFVAVFAAIFSLIAPDHGPGSASIPASSTVGPVSHNAWSQVVDGQHSSRGSSDTSDGDIPEPVQWSHGHDGSWRNGEEHWHKHGSDFPQYGDAQQYENGAQSFAHAPPPGTEVKHRSNGDTLLYNSDSNTFAVEDRNGRPRTMFKPDRGRAYWDRQDGN